MGHYPAIKDFIQQKAGAVKNLEVTYTQGAPPNLYMKDSSGSIVDEVRFAHHRNGIRTLSHREKGVRAYPLAAALDSTPELDVGGMRILKAMTTRIAERHVSPPCCCVLPSGEHRQLEDGAHRGVSCGEARQLEARRRAHRDADASTTED